MEGFILVSAKTPSSHKASQTAININHIVSIISNDDRCCINVVDQTECFIVDGVSLPDLLTKIAEARP